jgi:sterol desaturase/sphingolipid hydroxylase (fatty acid hydroxylase superfamily)
MAEAWFSNSMRLSYLVVACIALAAVEGIWPLVRFPRERRQHYLPNLALSGLLVVSNLVLAAIPTAASVWAARYGIGLFQALTLNSWLVLLVGVAGLDFAAYWAHRTLHFADVGWRFHVVHHSERYVDVTTAFRQHPVETASRIAFTSIGVATLGVPLWCLAIYLAMSALNALLEHSNLALSPRLDAWLRTVFVTPSMHKVHHSRAKAETNSNYSNILSIWDRSFGTYRPALPGHPAAYGLDGFDGADLQTVRGVLLRPLEQHRRTGRGESKENSYEMDHA